MSLYKMQLIVVLHTFTSFYNDKYFLVINNGSPFDIEGIQSILNIAQTTKDDPDKIGRFGIGFKLTHRLVGENEGTDEYNTSTKFRPVFKLKILLTLNNGKNEKNPQKIQQ